MRRGEGGIAGLTLASKLLRRERVTTGMSALGNISFRGTKVPWSKPLWLSSPTSIPTSLHFGSPCYRTFSGELHLDPKAELMYQLGNFKKTVIGH